MEDQRFLNESKLHVLVSQRTSDEIKDSLTEWSNSETGEDQPTLEILRDSRDLLFFDELLPIHIVLETTGYDEDTLKDYLAKISISLQLQAYGQAPTSNSASGQQSPERSPSRSEDIIWSGNVEPAGGPFVVVKDLKVSDTSAAFILWSIDVVLNRPRIRLLSPMIDIKGTANLRPSADTTHRLQDPFLPSGFPGSVNLLEPLGHDPALHGPPPRLTAARLARIPLGQGTSNIARSLRKSNVSTHRAVPAISSRVHYTKSKNNAGRASLIASLDVEVAPFSNEDLEISSVQMSLSEGTSLDLVSSHVSKSSIHRPKDIVVYLFRLTVDNTRFEEPGSTSAQTVDVAIDASVLVSKDCKPSIRMRWKTGVDFSAALNPTYGAPGQSMQRQRRPTSLPVAPPPLNGNGLSISAQGSEEKSPDGPPKTRQRAVSISDIGVTITFIAPNVVGVGQPFMWNILVYNGSSRPRRLAVMAIPRRKSHHMSKPSGSSSSGVRRFWEKGVADAIVDENLLYASQKSAGSIDAQWQVLCLTPEIRFGSLNPGTCVDVNMEFLALTEGFLQLEAVRVSDLTSGDIIDIRDLPDIVAKR